MTEYLLIFRDHENQWAQFSPEQMQQVGERFEAWRQSLRKKDAFLGAGKLTQELGVTVRKPTDEFVIDGPFTEAKEAVAGYYCVRADTLNQATEFAKGFPMLDYGGSVEVREMALVQTA